MVENSIKKTFYSDCIVKKPNTGAFRMMFFCHLVFGRLVVLPRCSSVLEIKYWLVSGINAHLYLAGCCKMAESNLSKTPNKPQLSLCK